MPSSNVEAISRSSFPHSREQTMPFKGLSWNVDKWTEKSPQHSMMALFNAKKSAHSSSEQKPYKRYALRVTSSDNKPYKSNTNSPMSSSSSAKRIDKKNQSQKDAKSNPSPLVSTILSFQNDIVYDS
jgi:sulfite reductase alpha subunit-like flavoprotein